jgi:hypothetical protein
VRDLLLVVPSRGRPASIARLAAAMDDTCEGDTSLLVGLDSDDPALASYPQGLARVGYVVRSGLRQVVAWINCLAAFADEFRFTGHIGDDNLPRTPGWDTRIMKALGETPFAFGNDLYPTRPPGSLSCHVFCRSEVIRRLGYFGPPAIRHMFVDVAWYAWGQGCGITFLPDVIIEHLHYTLGKSPMDDSNVASLACTAADLGAWHAYSRGGGLNEDILKIDPQGGRLFTPDSLRAFNAALNIPEVWMTA